jgi:hypothetical protein
MRDVARKSGMVVQLIKGLQIALEEERSRQGACAPNQLPQRKERRKSVSERLAKLSSPLPVIGTYRLISSKNYDEFLRFGQNTKLKYWYSRYNKM